jgi:hypothetical protein
MQEYSGFREFQFIEFIGNFLLNNMTKQTMFTKAVKFTHKILENFKLSLKLGILVTNLNKFNIIFLFYFCSSF